MKQKLFVLGATGSVGGEFIRQTLSFDTEKCEIAGLASSRQFLFDTAGVGVDGVDRLKTEGKPYESLLELLDAVGDLKSVVFVDLTAGKEDLLEFHLKVIRGTSHRIVTANKNPLALGSVEDFRTLTQNPTRYASSVTVMAGGGPVPFVQQRTLIQDDILSIQGCFSGTLTYILSELDKGEKPFSQIVREAKQAGYTEPNPWDDLNGVDVARKVLILARYAGYAIDFSDIELEPLIAEEFGNIEGEEFLQALSEVDAYFEARRIESADRDNVLRYVGQFLVENDRPRLIVGLQEVPSGSPIGGLSGTENIMVAQTKYFADPVPHVIKSRGAGLAVTASAMRIGVLGNVA